MTVVTMQNLKNNNCRWPIGDPQDADFHFCGDHSELDETYCPNHAALAYRSDTRNRTETLKRAPITEAKALEKAKAPIKTPAKNEAALVKKKKTGTK